MQDCFRPFGPFLGGQGTGEHVWDILKSFGYNIKYLKVLAREVRRYVGQSKKDAEPLHQTYYETLRKIVRLPNHLAVAEVRRRQAKIAKNQIAPENNRRNRFYCHVIDAKLYDLDMGELNEMLSDLDEKAREFGVRLFTLDDQIFIELALSWKSGDLHNITENEVQFVSEENRQAVLNCLHEFVNQVRYDYLSHRSNMIFY